MAIQYQHGIRPTSLTASWILVTCLAVGCASSTPPSIQAPGQTGSALNLAADSTGQTRRLQIFQQTLQSTSPDMDAATRQAAATELLAQPSQEAISILAAALDSGREVEVTAVIAALASENQPTPALLQPTILALASVPAANRVALGGLLARYAQDSPGTLDSIVSHALDEQAALPARESAIVCLGEFHTQPAESAGALVQLLQQSPPPPLAEMAIRSLAQLTGLHDLKDTEAWLAWWDDNRDRPASLWLLDTIQAQSRRLTTLETQLRQALDQDRLVVTRLMTVYRDLWPLLEVEEQVERIPSMLEDDQAEVRSFAVDRIAVLLRDGHATEVLEHAVVERLGDPEASIRRQVAAILTELSNPKIVDTVAARLEFETDPEVLNATLRYLQTRGDRNSLAKVLPLLSRERTRDAAAATTWSLLRDGLPSREEQTTVLAAIGPEHEEHNSPAEVALRILVGPDEALHRAGTFLDHPDSNFRIAVAKALLRRGRHAPILERGTDTAIYPIAIEAALDMPANQALDRIDRILRIPPPQESQRAAWAEAIAQASETVPLDQQALLDDRLARHPQIDEAIRITILDQALAQESLDIDTRIAVLKRLVPLLMQSNKTKTAVILLEDIHQRDPELAEMRFQAALRERDFPAAASVHDEPGPWVAAYEMLQETYPDESEALRDEITQRFSETLDEAMLTRLGIPVDPLMEGPDGSASDPEETDDGQSR